MHTFLRRFDHQRLSQRGGMVVSRRRGKPRELSSRHQSKEHEPYAAMGCARDGGLQAQGPEPDSSRGREFGEGCHLPILTGSELGAQQIQNAWRCWQIMPKG